MLQRGKFVKFLGKVSLISFHLQMLFAFARQTSVKASYVRFRFDSLHLRWHCNVSLQIFSLINANLSPITFCNRRIVFHTRANICRSFDPRLFFNKCTREAEGNSVARVDETVYPRIYWSVGVIRVRVHAYAWSRPIRVNALNKRGVTRWKKIRVTFEAYKSDVKYFRCLYTSKEDVSIYYRNDIPD